MIKLQKEMVLRCPIRHPLCKNTHKKLLQINLSKIIFEVLEQASAGSLFFGFVSVVDQKIWELKGFFNYTISSRFPLKYKVII